MSINIIHHSPLKAELNKKDVLLFLNEVDSSFPVPISEKTDLVSFAEKLCEKANLFVCTDGSRIIGMIAVYIDCSMSQAAYLTMAVVTETFRKRGISQKIYDAVEEYAISKGIKAIHLYAVEDNLPAMRFWQKNGFIIWNREDEPRPEDIHFIKYIAGRNVLVTSIGSFSADVVLKNTRKMGCKNLIGADINMREVIANSTLVDSYYQVPLVADDRYMKAVSDICEKEKITHIVPLIDPEVEFFAKNRKAFEDQGIIVCISPKDTIRLCRNKFSQHDFILANVPEIDVIPTIRFEEGMDIPYEMPFICKVCNGRSSNGLQIIHDRNEWECFKTNSDRGSYIIQPFITGKIITVDIVRSRDGKTCVAIPRMEYLRTLNGAGTSVKVFEDHSLEEKCRILADKMGIVGCVNFEFICSDDGKYYYLECNPRFSGGVEFSCIAGYDCIGNTFKCFENLQAEGFKLDKEMFIARKYEAIVTKVDELKK